MKTSFLIRYFICISGASFIDLLSNFGVDNSINVFLLVLLQQNIMVHSLRRAVLTGVIEAISCVSLFFLVNLNYLKKFI